MNMSFLLVAQPMFPLRSLTGGGPEDVFAMLVGVGGAWLTYAVFLPSNPIANQYHFLRRIQRLTKAIRSELRPDRLWRYQRAMAEALLSLAGTEEPEGQMAVGALPCLGWARLIADAQTKLAQASAWEQGEFTPQIKQLMVAATELRHLITPQRSKN
jgi:hypothetical protein